MASGQELVFTLIGVDRLSKPLKNAGSEVEKVGGKFSKLKVAGGLAMAALAVGAVELGKKAVDAFQEAGAETLALQRVMGGTAQQASRLNFAAEETGISGDKLAMSMKFLAKFTTAAQQQLSDYNGKVVLANDEHKKFRGNLGANATALSTLGIAYEDAKGHVKSMGSILSQVAQRFHDMPAGANKTALAVKIFGKSGTVLLPFLNKGAEGLKELGVESDKLGHTLTGPQLAAIHKNIVAHREFKAAVSGVEIQLGAALYPALAKIVPAVAGFAASIAQKIIPQLKIFGTWISAKLMPALAQAYTQIFPGVKRSLDSLGSALKSGGVNWHNIGAAITGVIKVAGVILSVVLPQLIDSYKRQIVVIVDVVKAFVRFGSAAKTAFGVVVTSFLNLVGTVVDGAARAFGWVPGIGGKLKSAAKKFDAFRDSVNASLSGIHNKSVYVTITPKVKGSKALGKAAAAGVLGGTGTADGSGYWPGGVTEVNEHGREFIDLPRGSKIHTATESSRMTKGAPTVVHLHGQVFSGPAVVQMLQEVMRATGKPIQIKTA